MKDLDVNNVNDKTKIIPKFATKPVKNINDINNNDTGNVAKNVDPEVIQFIQAVEDYKEGYKGICDWLVAIKGRLRSCQKDPESNFGGKKREGTEGFRRLTEQIQSAINAFKSGKKKSYLLGKDLTNVISAARDFVDETTYVHMDGMKGEAYNTANMIIGDGYTLTNMLYNLRVGLAGVSKPGALGGLKIPYGNLSYIEIETKAKEIAQENNIIVRDKDTDKIVEPFKKPDFDLMYDKSVIQLAISKKLEKVSKTMCRNFEYTRKVVPDSYLKMLKKRSASAIARWIVTKKYLEKVYNPNVSMEKLKELGKVDISGLKAEIKKLSNDPVFIQVVKRYPDNAFSEWEKIEKDEYLKECNREMSRMLNGKSETDWLAVQSKLYKSNQATIEEGTRGLTEACKYSVYKALSSPGGKQMRRVLAAADKETRDKIIDDLAEGLRVNVLSKNYDSFINNKNKTFVAAILMRVSSPDVVIEYMSRHKPGNDITNSGKAFENSIRKHANTVKKQAGMKK